MAIELIGPASGSPLEILQQARVQEAETFNQNDLKRASLQFESYFLSYLLKVMRETVPKGGLLQNRMGEVFHSFYDEEIGKRAAEAGGIGLAQLILSSLAEESDKTVSRHDEKDDLSESGVFDRPPG
jgi:flagellar protein FlgJ